MRAGLTAQPTLSLGWAASPDPFGLGFSPDAGPSPRPGLAQGPASVKPTRGVLIHSPHATFAETMNSGKEDFRVWRMEHLFIPLGRGDRGDSYGACFVGSGGLWWSE